MKAIYLSSTPLVLVAASLALSSCGFDSSKRNPLTEGESASYQSQGERHLQQKEMEKRFLQETKAYQESIQKIQGEANRHNQELESRFNKMITDLQGQAQVNQSRCEAEKRQFAQDLNTYRTEQNQVITELQTALKGWEDQARSCQQILENPERQNFNGLLYRSTMDSSLPQSLEFSVQESSSHGIFFKLDLSHSAVTGLQIEPALPQGLTLTRQNDETWVIQGTPQIRFASGETQRRSLHTVFPVIDLSQIEDEDARALIEQQNFEQRVMISIYSGQIPSVEGNLANREGDRP